MYVHKTNKTRQHFVSSEKLTLLPCGLGTRSLYCKWCVGVGYCYILSVTVHMFDGDSLLVLRGPVEAEEPGQDLRRWMKFKIAPPPPGRG